jgi:hypothetical protein
VEANLEKKALTPEEDHMLELVAGVLYGAASDTVRRIYNKANDHCKTKKHIQSTSLLHSFFLHMILNPDIQARAQAEIDARIGQDRLPTLRDREYLPYVEALSKEVLRLSIILPGAIPHKVRQDDVHEGYFIPKDAVVIPNVWSVLLLPSQYARLRGLWRYCQLHAP